MNNAFRTHMSADLCDLFPYASLMVYQMFTDGIQCSIDARTGNYYVRGKASFRPCERKSKLEYYDFRIEFSSLFSKTESTYPPLPWISLRGVEPFIPVFQQYYFGTLPASHSQPTVLPGARPKLSPYGAVPLHVCLPIHLSS